jgi:hypothetical protein
LNTPTIRRLTLPCRHQFSALAPQQFHAGHSCLRSIYIYFRLGQCNPVASRGDAHVGLDVQT